MYERYTQIISRIYINDVTSASSNDDSKEVLLPEIKYLLWNIKISVSNP